jgi:hypothetical protein
MKDDFLLSVKDVMRGDEDGRILAFVDTVSFEGVASFPAPLFLGPETSNFQQLLSWSRDPARFQGGIDIKICARGAYHQHF